jgi:hypothetical protein
MHGRSTTNSRIVIRDLQQQAFYLAVKVGLMSRRSQDPLNLFDEKSKKKLMKSIHFFQTYIDKNEYNDRIPSNKEVVKEMKIWLNLEMRGPISGGTLPKAFEGLHPCNYSSRCRWSPSGRHHWVSVSPGELICTYGCKCYLDWW